MKSASVALLVPVLSACFGSSVEKLDAEDARALVRQWTNVTLPDAITVLDAEAFSAFMDPSMHVVFDAPTSDVERFVAQLGERRRTELAADCRDPSAPVRFTEIDGTMTVLDPKPVGESDLDGYGSGGDYLASRLVAEGLFERCRNVVTIFARPTSPLVNVVVQERAGATSRVGLYVAYT